MQSVKYDLGDTGLFRYGSYSNLPQINQLCFHNGFADFYQTRRDRNQGSKYCKVDNLYSRLSWIRIQYKFPVTPQDMEERRKIGQLFINNTNVL